MLEVGTKVKDFMLKDSLGNETRLSDYLGKKIVLYFYPKNNTPGCNSQACGFRDNFNEYENEDVVVLGISKDDIGSHLNFKNKFNLPFKTLSDESLEVIKYFEAYGEKSMFGKKYMGILRITYIIDENGIIIYTMPKVSAKDNAKDVLKVLKKLK
ncbi:thioredoxin-dependent thiol peroxidase [Haploplasma modicum]|uniref:thioredoxin-dependent thiol peroxidase n=1 Tax=Haploplasma modicum TaxID=2150 RepID=UPI00214B76FF|nr:thioredoxin-dependent thiol peroxidase [Haploplasma modicum]MCR1809415.1 thioredoxin-dependent thiol peroxidase [Haploplasma modicum]